MATTEPPTAPTADADPAGPVRAAQFQPPRGLRNPHVQSVLASSGLRRWLGVRRHTTIERDATEHLLDCGDGVRLQGFHTAQRVREQARGVVVLLHGWEGSVRSTYVLNTGTRLLADGFDVFRLNFRDHGDTHHLNSGLFHSCRIDEVVGAVCAVQRQFPRLPLALAGFSLGGNFALRVALRAPAAGIAVRYVIAVCPVVDPGSGLFGLEHAPFFYQSYFVRKWRHSLRRKQALFPGVEWFSRADLGGNLRELTRALVLRHTTFGSLENYLDGYSIAADRLQDLRMPATILTAADDPVIPVANFHSLRLPAHVELDIAARGGHCGFIRDYALHSFTDGYIAERVRLHLAAAAPGDPAAPDAA